MKRLKCGGLAWVAVIPHICDCTAAGCCLGQLCSNQLCLGLAWVCTSLNSEVVLGQGASAVPDRSSELKHWVKLPGGGMSSSCVWPARLAASDLNHQPAAPVPGAQGHRGAGWGLWGHLLTALARLPAAAGWLTKVSASCSCCTRGRLALLPKSSCMEKDC